MERVCDCALFKLWYVTGSVMEDDVPVEVCTCGHALEEHAEDLRCEGIVEIGESHEDPTGDRRAGSGGRVH